MEINPNKQERSAYEKKAKEIVRLLEKQIPQATIILGGSGAKDTWLVGDHDIDVFVAYPLAYKEKNISNLLEKELKNIFKNIERLHGSRDYFQINHQGCKIEIVPILAISAASQAVNITDVSPLHSIWVNKHAKGLKEEIRKAKLFCKAQRLYGAESYIGGFSGYILEILIVQYGSFENLLQASTKWKKGEVIDVAQHYPKKDATFHINTSKLLSPIIVVDPVDKSRNAAAALSDEKCNLFRKQAKAYLKNPNPSYFVKEDFSVENISKKAKEKKLHAIHYTITPLTGKKDVVGAKLKKVFTFLEKELKEFSVKQADWDWSQENAQMFFLVKKKKLSATKEHFGPLTNMTQAAQAFKKKHKQVVEKEGRLIATLKRKYTTLEEVAPAIVKKKYVLERIQEVKSNIL